MLGGGYGSPNPKLETCNPKPDLFSPDGAQRNPGIDTPVVRQYA